MVETKIRAGGAIRTLVLLTIVGATAFGWLQAASGVEPKRAEAASPAQTTRPTRLALARVSPGAIRAIASSATERREGRAPDLLVRIPRTMVIRARPDGGGVVGWLPATSRYYHVPLVAWILRTSADGRFGLVIVPYSGSRRSGWIRLRGLERAHTTIEVHVDLSRHELVVLRRDRRIARFPAATGAPLSPTPPGRYFVTDRIAFPAGGTYGTFAFGLSGIQTHLPAGWKGGDQLAIHGTDMPWSLGTSSSAGCIRVSERALATLRPLLRLGTPVIVVP